MAPDHPADPRSSRLSRFANRYALAAFVVQTLSYAALVGFVDHGPASPLVALLRDVPTVLAAVLGVFAVPAFLVTVAIGAGLEALLGVSLRGLGTGLVSGSDLPFLVVAALLSLGFARLVARWRGETKPPGGEAP